MKKMFQRIASVILVVLLVGVLPAIFMFLVAFATNQSFGVGLVIITTLSVIQLLMGQKNHEAFHWTKYKDFSLWGLTRTDKIIKSLNILFNLSKVLTLLGLINLIYQNYSEKLNDFRFLVITLSCLSLVIILLLTFSPKKLQNYQFFRAILSIVLMLVVATFIYATFTTQLIWVLLLVVVLFSLMNGYDEVTEKWKIEDGVFEFYTILVVLLSAIVSTIIQFWSHIVDFMVILWKFILGIFTNELGGVSVWVIFLATFFLILIIYSIFTIQNNVRRKNEYLEARRKSQEEKEKQRENERVANEIKLKKIQDLANALETREITYGELNFLAINALKLNYLHKFSVQTLTYLELKKYFKVSEIKRQIVWDPIFVNVLNMYIYIFEKNYEDDNLNLIISSIADLENYLKNYKDFIGYEAIKKIINETGIPKLTV